MGTVFCKLRWWQAFSDAPGNKLTLLGGESIYPWGMSMEIEGDNEPEACSAISHGSPDSIEGIARQPASEHI